MWPLDALPLEVRKFQMRVFVLGSKTFKIRGFFEIRRFFADFTGILLGFFFSTSCSAVFEIHIFSKNQNLRSVKPCYILQSEFEYESIRKISSPHWIN